RFVLALVRALALLLVRRPAADHDEVLFRRERAKLRGDAIVRARIGSEKAARENDQRRTRLSESVRDTKSRGRILPRPRLHEPDRGRALARSRDSEHDAAGERDEGRGDRGRRERRLPPPRACAQNEREERVRKEDEPAE